MSTHYEYEDNIDLEIPELDEDWVKDLSRLEELKAQKTCIEEEIALINASASDQDLFGQFTDASGVSFKVVVRRDPLAPKVNLAALAQVNPELALKISTTTVDATRLKEAISRGYFTNTEAASLLTTGFKKSWVQVTKLA